MPSDGPTAVEVAPQDLTLGDADPTIANLEDVYLDGTLVLIGCGAAKRDPEDELDCHAAAVGPEESFGPDWTDETGPAWYARDLYTSNYFAAKREFAELVSQWTGPDDGSETAGWAILSAEHGVVQPWETLKHYDTSIDDIGDDPTNPEDRVRNPMGLRRPDGQEIVTEMDRWSSTVTHSLMKWIAGHREMGAPRWENDANTLLVLAGQSYLDPLRERGVFEYGIDRMHGDPNHVFEFPVQTRYLFENLPASDGMFDQMAWLSDAVDRLDVEHRKETRQAEAGEWTGDERSCDHCGVSAREDRLVDIAGEVVCPDCHPEECARCGEWTRENGLGAYPLCSDCQTERGGQTTEPLDDDGREQTTLEGESDA